MIKYLAEDWYRAEIKTVEVEKETVSSVWVNGRQCRKQTTNTHVFDTWDEARSWLLKRAESVAESLRRQLETANGKLGNVKGMKPPKEPTP